MKQKQAGPAPVLVQLWIFGVIAAIVVVNLLFWVENPICIQPDPQQSSTESLEILSKVDLNTADAGELCTLPGVTQALAQEILIVRERRGSFERVEDLVRVQGITRQMVTQWIEQGRVYLS